MPGEDKHNKTEDPTAHRIEKAREEGNVFRAQELVSVGLLTIGAATVILGMPAFFDALQAMTARIFSEADTPFNPHSLTSFVTRQVLRLVPLLVPFFLFLLAGGVLLNVLQSGWNLTFKPLQPKMERISPIKGFQRIFSLKGLAQLVKAAGKIGVVAPIVYFVISGHLDEIIGLIGLGIPQILGTVGELITELVIQMVIAFLILTAMDFAYQRWQYKEDLKMSKRDVKEERKQKEGDPQVKSKRRERAQELAHQPRLDHAVMNSDAVVTNPTHYAVGLIYEPNERDAPRVTVKGVRKRAQTIKRMAREFDVPIVENPPLARALHGSVEVDEEIPQELYPAVAAMLAEIYRQQDDNPYSYSQ